MSESNFPSLYEQDDEDENPADELDMGSPSQGKKSRISHIWLLSMTDMVTLLLTFFVFIFSQSAFRNVPYDAVEHRIEGNRDDRFFGKDQYVYGVDQRETALSLSTQYLYRILKAQFAKNELLRQAQLSAERNWVVMSFPDNLIFDNGDDRLDARAKLALFDIAAVLRNVANRIEIVGHSTPDPYPQAPKRFPSNWYLSFARALEVHRILKESGVAAPMTVLGRANALYDSTISSALTPRLRAQLGRRVDIVIYDEKP